MQELNEKIAVSDILSGINSAITMLSYSIQQANNQEFRNTLIQMRNKLEESQYEVYLIAKQKGYYVPAAPAGKADIEQVKQVACK